MRKLDFYEVKERVIEVVKRSAVFNSNNVNENSRLREDHGIDSIKMVELVVNLEDEFNFEVDNTSLSYENFANVELIADYIIKKMS